jgi:glycosyltransferase involved in cell wall biosynthesis
MTRRRTPSTEGPKTIALVGPAPESRGGIAATIRGIACSPLRQRYGFVCVATYADGSPTRKASCAAAGLTRLAVLLARGQVDLVHVHCASGASFVRKLAAVQLARLADRPTVFHVHGGDFAVKLAAPGVRGRVYRRAFRHALEHANAVVALTEGWAAELRRFGTMRRLAVVPNSPDLPASPNGRGAPGATPYLLYLGHLYRQKGLFELLDAFAALRSRRPELRLVLAGESLRRDDIPVAELLAYAGERGLDTSAVLLPGWVDGERKAELVAATACVVLPSHREGLPLVLLEAMAAGRPVVATTVGGVPEAVRDGIEGLLVEPGDPAALAAALGRVLDDPGLADSMGAAGRRRVLEEYSPDAVATRIGDLYEEVLSKQ